MTGTITSMLRASVLTLLAAVAPATSLQPLAVLRITVVLVDAERKPTPVPRHSLLVSDNPATAAPRLIVTGLDGAVDVRLRPGSYIVESDRPVSFQGKAYRWTRTVSVTGGQNAVLELTADNAEVEPLAAGAAAGQEDDPSFRLPQWNDSVVGVWTPTAHASGFVIDPKGLVVTNQQVVGTAASVEVQLTPAIKVAANVLAADPAKDVAVLWMDPAAIASVRPVPLSCNEPEKSAVVSGEPIFNIGVSLRQVKDLTPANVGTVGERGFESDFELAFGSTGGPVFTARGDFVGITSFTPASDPSERGEARVVRAREVCDVVASAEKKMAGAAARPSGTRLPVEAQRPVPVDAFKQSASRRVGSLNPYQIATSGFDVAFITPMVTYGTQYQAELARRRGRAPGTRAPASDAPPVSPLLEFGNWSDYVWDFPPVLLIRVTPRLVEGFWTTVARGAAMTQGVALPPIKRFKAGFARMRAFCGDTDVTPIHPFKLERRVSESDAIYEGLYVFDPDALGPACKAVKLTLYSEKEPDKGDTRVVEPAIIQQIWDDFAPYRDVAASRATNR